MSGTEAGSAAASPDRPNPWRIDSQEDRDLLAPTAPDLSLQRPTTPGPQLPELQIDDESLAAALSDEDAYTTPRGSLDPPGPTGAVDQATISTEPADRPGMSTSSSFMRYFGGLRPSQSYRNDSAAEPAGPRLAKRSSSGIIASLSAQSQSGKGWWGPVVPPDAESGPASYPRPSTTPRKPRQERQPSTVPSLFHQRLTGSGWFGPMVSPDPSASRLPSSKPGHAFPTASSPPASPSSPVVAGTAAERETQRLEREARDAERLQSIRDGTAGASRSARRPGLVKRLSSGVSMKNFSLAALKAPLVTATRSQRSHTRSTIDDTSQAAAAAEDPRPPSTTGPEAGGDDGQTWRPIGGQEEGGAGWQGETHYVADAPVAQPPTLADVVEEPSPAATPSPRPTSPPAAEAVASPDDFSTPVMNGDHHPHGTEPRPSSSSKERPTSVPSSPRSKRLSMPETERVARDDRLAEEAW